MAELPGPDQNAGTPLWVKVFGIVTIAVILLLVVVMLAGGEHGPVRHLP